MLTKPFTIDDEERAKSQYENRCPECGRICLAENLENHISKHQVSGRSLHWERGLKPLNNLPSTLKHWRILQDSVWRKDR